MFYYVNGTVTELEAGLAVIDCGGVGYACATTNYTLSQLKKGERAKLYTYLNVREDAMELFGFADDLGRVHAAEHDAAVLRQAADQIRHIIVPPIGYTA